MTDCGHTGDCGHHGGDDGFIPYIFDSSSGGGKAAGEKASSKGAWVPIILVAVIVGAVLMYDNSRKNHRDRVSADKNGALQR